MPTSPLFAIPMLEGGSDYPSPDAIADAKQVNDQFKYLEQFVGVQEVTSGTLPSSPKEQQFIYETDTGRVRYWDGTQWVTIAYRMVGTTAQRNALYPTPATPSARVALANAAPLWFNTEKGWQEQYYAQYDDAGAVATTPVREVHGWGPAQHLGLIPLTQFVANQAGAAPTVVSKRGSRVKVTTAGAAIDFDNVFTSDFKHYKIRVYGGSSVGTDLSFQLRAAGVLITALNYSSNRFTSNQNSTTTITALGGQDRASCGRFEGTPLACTLELDVYGPADAVRTWWMGQSYDGGNYHMMSAGAESASAARDGFRVSVNPGTFSVGTTVTIFGVNEV